MLIYFIFLNCCLCADFCNENECYNKLYSRVEKLERELMVMQNIHNIDLDFINAKVEENEVQIIKLTNDIKNLEENLIAIVIDKNNKRVTMIM